MHATRILASVFMVGLIGFSMPAPAQADAILEDGYHESFRQCLNSVNGSTASITGCIDAELRKQDALLNRYYKTAMKGLSPAKQNELRDSQRAWLKGRELDSRVLSGLTGGTIDTIIEANAFLRNTMQRAQFLKRIADEVK